MSGNHRHDMNHIVIRSGTFGDDLTSLWYNKKCRIYESNRIESPSLYDENAMKIFNGNSYAMMVMRSVELNHSLS
jgi:hypothetical protein